MTKTSSNYPRFINKSFLTNLVAFLCVIAALFLPESIKREILNIGLFSLSGAITNWLAVHMLFEKVPGIYGSGVVPARFEDFKLGIQNLVMNQFFSKENLDNFFGSTANEEASPVDFDLSPIINEIDLDPIFDILVNAIMESSFGGMLAMVGGKETIESFRESFVGKMRVAFKDMLQGEAIRKTIQANITNSSTTDKILDKINSIVQMRLDELTPQLVKEIVQEMIRSHLGWLVVWGGLFGGLIGMIANFLPI